MTTRATWCLSNNFGDTLTPWIVNKITGQWPAYVPPAMGGVQRAMLCGSVLNHAEEHTHVAGAGVAWLRDEVRADANYYAVRGPLSRQVVLAAKGQCPDVYGDPAMLLPRWINPGVVLGTKHAVGIVPHYTDHARSLVWWGGHIAGGRLKFVNVFAPVEEFVRDLCSCAVVLSSSLHGLVVADAYGIPCEWVTIDQRMIGGDGTKYRDHAAAMGYELTQPTELVGEPPERLAAIPRERKLTWTKEKELALFEAVQKAIRAAGGSAREEALCPRR